ncbi:hypothetical protein [Butyrivibrio sp. AE3004]|uniref:hypothetical protein n=1 Tax=Butyrivibrio sp. AE3004 TaxID=1506994 RepID=UPI00049454BE|nr:hypothetical protein [Butyrivibrio sp. AE3004]
MENEELLKKIAENSEKSLKFHRISALCLIGIFCVVLISAINIVPKAQTTINEIYLAAQSSREMVSDAQKTMEKVNEMTASLTDTSDKMNELLVENSGTITESLDKMSKVDFDGLNAAIQDLQDAVGPFAKFMKSFGR